MNDNNRTDGETTTQICNDVKESNQNFSAAHQHHTVTIPQVEETNVGGTIVNALPCTESSTHVTIVENATSTAISSNTPTTEAAKDNPRIDHVHPIATTLESKTVSSSSAKTKNEGVDSSNGKKRSANSSPIGSNHSETNNTLSKSQHKRRRRYEKLMALKEQKKQQRKEVKIAKAMAAGRDVDAERQFMAQRTEQGDGNRKRQEEWERINLPLVQNSFQICLDCSFESYMTAKEVNSLALQIRYCYATNKRSKHPCGMVITSVTGETRSLIEKVSGWEQWHKRAFTLTDATLEDHYKDRMDRIVYLTSDAEEVLSDLDDSKIYVIGGIVDRNRLKGIAKNRADKLGVTTARLPIDQYLRKMEATRVLTCNHVCDLLLAYRDNGKDWRKAFLQVLPERKGAELVEN